MLGMNRNRRVTDVPLPQKGPVSEPKAEDSFWTYLPIVLSAAAICLLLFFFLTPDFEAAEAVRARSARPGAETAVTQHKDTLIERQKEKRPP